MKKTSLIDALDLHKYEEKQEIFIRVFDNFLPNDLCDLLINFFNNNKGFHYNNKTIDDNIKEDIYLKKYKKKKEIITARKSIGINIDFLHKKFSSIKIYKLIYQIIYKTFDKGLKLYLKKLPGNQNIKSFNDENYFITKYIKKEGFYKWHSDRAFMSHKSNNRYISAILYLNNVDIGGETEFKYHKKIVKPKKGRLLIFPSDWTYVHRGKTPISNDKYICNNFFSLY